jgi:Glycosyl hydrolases family 25
VVAEPSGPKVGFIDTSEWRGHVDCPRVAQAGHVGVFPRTTAGTSLDPYWRDTCEGALSAGLVTMARHRLYGSPSTKAQFDAFAREAERVVPGCQGILVSLDSEDDATWAQCSEFEQRAYDRWGTWLVGYYPCWWLDRLPGDPVIRREVTWWHSRYASSPGELCGGRTSLAGQMWQYTAEGTCPGVNPPVDLNWYYGTRAQLQALAVGGGGAAGEMTDDEFLAALASPAAQEALAAAVKAGLDQALGKWSPASQLLVCLPGDSAVWAVTDGGLVHLPDPTRAGSYTGGNSLTDAAVEVPAGHPVWSMPRSHA